MFYKAREKVIKLSDDYTAIVSKVKYEAANGKGIKILTFKQILQRLPIPLAQVNTGNASGNLINEIKQIIYYLYQAKEITKKLHNNKVNSIKL